jgi:SAM-dependent methyltransferase
VTSERFACQICAASTVEEVDGFARMPRVTSDCRPWPAGGRLAVCGSCAAVQKIADEEWHGDAAQIYEGYDLYPQGDGAEQAVFDGDGGKAESRSDRLLSHLLEYIRPEKSGRMLDIGCGNGAFLVAFGRRRDGWDLHGSELDERSLATLSTIPNFRKLHTCGLSEIGENFDCISLIHALEHFEYPELLLGQMRQCLSGSEAAVVVQVPDWRANPFDFLIADHLLHFGVETLEALLRRSGFEVLSIAQGWIPNEISAVARRGDRMAATLGSADTDIAAIHADIGRRLRWLEEVSNEARGLAVAGEIGIFGSSIAASWLHGAIGEKGAFFVDEDPNRQGRRHLGRPILTPGEVPQGSSVFVPLAPRAAGSIALRLGVAGGPRFVAPCARLDFT